MADQPKVLRFVKLKANEGEPDLPAVPDPVGGEPRKLFLKRRVPSSPESARPVVRLKKEPVADKLRPMLKKIGQTDPVISQRYTILHVINEGGMGTVCRAWDNLLKMDVALKMVKPEIAGDPESLAQLKAEAAVAMKLSHENIVRLHNIEAEKGRIFIVMEYVDGQTLRMIIEQMGALSCSAVLDIAHALSEALMYAHSRGVLHRDIKPENLMINSAFGLKVLDFGIAIKIARGAGCGDTIEGSPGYISPEQLKGLPLDVRADVFSVAVVLCELLTAIRPYPVGADLMRIYDAPPAGLEQIPVPVAAVLARGMALDPEHRWASIADFYGAFQHALRPLIT